jgi:hypothetical protein
MAETRRGRNADSRRGYRRLRHIYGSWLDGGRRLYVYPARRLRGFSCVLTQMISAVAGPWICNGEVGLHRAGRFGTTVTVAFMGTGTENIHSDSGMRISVTVKFAL